MTKPIPYKGTITLQDGDLSPTMQKALLSAMFDLERQGIGHAGKVKPLKGDAYTLKVGPIPIYRTRPVIGVEVQSDTPEGVEAFLTGLSRSVFAGHTIDVDSPLRDNAAIAFQGADDHEPVMITIEAE